MCALIKYIRYCFCKHNWECLIDKSPIYDSKHKNFIGYEWLYRCKKCGFEDVVIFQGGNKDE